MNHHNKTNCYSSDALNHTPAYIEDLKGISTTAALRFAALRCAAIVSDSPR